MKNRNRAFDDLRSFAIILVVLHHSILAYSTLVDFNDRNPVNNVSPVVDSDVFPWFNLIIAINDTFFMFLLFFVSGLFVWGSLQRKGVRKFLKERFIKLGLPFLIGVPILIPLAYYPAQLEIDAIKGNEHNFISYWLDLASHGFGTAGPLWFIWVLLVFNLIFIMLYSLAPGISKIFKRKVPIIFRHSSLFFLILIPISVLIYFPISVFVLIFKIPWWIYIGPFGFQTNRIFLYFLFFIAGAIIGGYGIDRTFLRKNGNLAKYWWVGLFVAVPFFLIFMIVQLGFVIACGSLILTVTGFFLWKKNKQNRFKRSFRQNSYGIFIVHYLFVIWMQYLLLDIPLPGFLKGLIVFVFALILSWFAVELLRKIPQVNRVI
jgi:surface polysaccharide O-acyltransferase-like enzyme